jgi:hypothetical protein
MRVPNRQERTRFLASLRNDRGGGIVPFALPGTTGCLAAARNDRGIEEMTEVKNDMTGEKNETAGTSVPFGVTADRSCWCAGGADTIVEV